jgi:hypothetical protein
VNFLTALPRQSTPPPTDGLLWEDDGTCFQLVRGDSTYAEIIPTVLGWNVYVLRNGRLSLLRNQGALCHAKSTAVYAVRRGPLQPVRIQP